MKSEVPQAFHAFDDTSIGEKAPESGVEARDHIRNAVKGLLAAESVIVSRNERVQQLLRDLGRR